MNRFATARRVLLIAAAAALFAFPFRATAAVADPQGSLVVFPFATIGGVDPAAGSGLAVKLADEIGSLGGVHVVKMTGSDAGASLGERARKAGADFYLSGSVAAVGSSANMLEQLVSTRSGVIVWSNTVHLVHYLDELGQGEIVREAFLAQSAPRYSFERVASPPAPALPASKRAAPKRPPAPPHVALAPAAALSASDSDDDDDIDVDATPPPRTTFVVVALGGPASASERSLADEALLHVLTARGESASIRRLSVGDLRIWGDEACSETQARSLIGGSLSTTSDETGVTPHVTAHLSVQSFDCAKHESRSRPIVADAVAFIVSDAVRDAASRVMSEYLGSAALARR